jgi:hypothetical protein
MDKTLLQMQEGIELAIKNMDDAERIHFVRQIALLSECYADNGDGGGVLLLRRNNVLFTVAINADMDEAFMLIETAAAAMAASPIEHVVH